MWRSEHQEIRKGDWMYREADRGKDDLACFYLRGLVPKMWTHRPITDEYHVEDIPNSEFEIYDPGTPVFLDGSGGPYSKDYRVRVCGWAWIQADIEITYGVAGPIGYWGRRGTTPGKQTVPRAETMALMKFLEFASQQAQVVQDTDVYTDNRGVYNRWHSGMITTHDENGALWDAIWYYYRAIE